MAFIVPCERCVIEYMEGKRDKDKIRPATERHHLFSQTKWARKLYGNLIDHPLNIRLLCYDHHHNKPLDKWTEQEFCDAIGIEPRSKELSK
jgi:hypothetical protein